MQFVTLSRRKTESFSDAQFAAGGANEAERIRQLYIGGHLRQIWRRTDLAGACILWEAESEEQVRSLVATLPFAQAGMLELVSVVPLAPYPGFGPKA